MTANTFPGTATAYTFLGSDPGNKKGYSAIFRAKGEPGGNMASVDAGDSGLYVGGGTVNQRFGDEMAPHGGAYLAIHKAALDGTRADKPVSASYGANDPVRLVMVKRAASDAASGPCPAETVFLDILAPATAPNGEPSNYALLYVVPPDGRDRSVYAGDAAFLAAVTRTAENAVALLADYNATFAALDSHLGLAAIPVLRTCLFSGGQFRPKTLHAADVAKAIFAGFAQALKSAGAGSGVTLVEFENGDRSFAALV